MLRFLPDPGGEESNQVCSMRDVLVLSNKADPRDSRNALAGFLKGYVIDHITASLVNGLLEGDASVYFESPHNDEYMECKYKKNVLDGKALLFDDNGICLLNATFVNGNIEGDVEIYDGGIPIFFGQFAQNEKNGYGYDKSHGEIVYEGYYKDGKRNGIGREYDEEGNVVADVVYVDGKKF